MKIKLITIGLCTTTFIFTLFMRKKFSNSHDLNKNYLAHEDNIGNEEDNPQNINIKVENHISKSLETTETRYHAKDETVEAQRPFQNKRKEKTAREEFLEYQQIKRVVSDVQLKTHEISIGPIMVKQLGLPIEKMKEFYRIKKSYRELDVNKEFDKFIAKKYGDEGLVDTHQEWENFQKYIHQKYESFIIDNLGRRNFDFYQDYKKKYLGEGIDNEPLHYPKLPNL